MTAETFQSVELGELRQQYPDCKRTLPSSEYEPGLQELVFRAERAFRKQFEYEAELFAKGSTRVEEFGNFTDQGFRLRALGFPTNLGIVSAASRRQDRIVRLWSDIEPDREPREIDLDDLPEVNDTKDWSNYEISILQQLRKFFIESGQEDDYDKLRGVDMCMVANVPPGTAISTSAAVEASFIHGFLGCNEVKPPARLLAGLTKKAENALESGCGFLDQATSNEAVPDGHGVLLRFQDPGDGISYTSTPIYMDLERHGGQIALVFAKGVSRNLAGTDYGRKAHLIKEGSQAIANALSKDVSSLTLAEVLEYYSGSIFLEEMDRAVIHVYTDDDRVGRASEIHMQLEAMEPGSDESLYALYRLGQLMDESANSSINNYGVATGIEAMSSFAPLLDIMRECGALGARNEGGGGIPTSIALVRREEFPDFSQTVPQIMKELFPDMTYEVVPVSLGKPSRVLQF